MTYLEKWFQDISSGPTLTWNTPLSAQGICDEYHSPRSWYAKVEIMISPSDHFEIIDRSEPSLNGQVDGMRWLKQIAFGVFDVMLTCLTAPIRDFEVAVLSFDFDEINTNPMAFRLAARDAALNILHQRYPHDAHPRR